MNQSVSSHFRTVFDESLVRRLLQKITVFEDHFTVEFKSGVTVDVNE
jgi:site-specific DNA recombinase